MAIASVGTLGSGTSTTSNASWTFTTSAQLDTGNVVVLVFSSDNEDTADANTKIHQAVDFGGLALTKAREFTNAQGAGNAGATVSIWYGKAIANIASASTVTLTLISARTSKAAAAWEYTVGAGNELYPVAGNDLANDAADAGSLSVTGMVSEEHLNVRATGIESNTATYTVTATYTALELPTANTGVVATSMGGRGEFKIETGTASTASNPTTSVHDQASTMVGFKERLVDGGWTVAKVFESSDTDRVSHPFTLTLAASIAVGHLCIVCHTSTIDSGLGVWYTDRSSAGWGGIIDVRDDAGNTWNRVAVAPIDGTNVFTTTEIFWSLVTSQINNGDVITLDGSTRGLSCVLGILDVTPPTAGSGSIDMVKSQSNSFTHNFTTGNGTTRSNNTLVVSVHGLGSGTPTVPWFVAPPGYRKLVDRFDGATIARGLAVSYKVLETAGTENANGGANGDYTGASTMAAFVSPEIKTNLERPFSAQAAVQRASSF